MIMEKKHLDVVNALIKSIQNMGENFTDNKFVKMSVTFKEDDSNDELTEVTLSFDYDGMKVSVDKLYDADEDEYDDCHDECYDNDDDYEECFCSRCGEWEEENDPTELKFVANGVFTPESYLLWKKFTDERIARLYDNVVHNVKYLEQRLMEKRQKEEMERVANDVKEEIKNKPYNVTFVQQFDRSNFEEFLKSEGIRIVPLNMKMKIEETKNYVDTKRKNFYHTSIGKIFYMDHAWQSDGKQLVNDILHMIEEERLGKGMSQTVLVIAKDRYQMNSIADNFANNVEETKNIVIDNKSAYIHIGNIMIQVIFLDEKNILDDIYGLPMFNLLINLTGDDSLNKYIKNKKE